MTFKQTSINNNSSKELIILGTAQDQAKAISNLLNNLDSYNYNITLQSSKTDISILHQIVNSAHLLLTAIQKLETSNHQTNFFNQIVNANIHQKEAKRNDTIQLK